MKSQLYLSFRLQPLGVTTSTIKTPKKARFSVPALPGTVERTVTGVADRTAITQRENLPELFARDGELSIDMMIEEHTKELESALERSFITNQQQRHAKSITMEETYDIYDRTATIFVDMDLQNVELGSVLDIGAETRLPKILTTICEERTEFEERENVPPVIIEPTPFADLFQVEPVHEQTMLQATTRTLGASSSSTNLAVSSRSGREAFRELSANERARLSMASHHTLTVDAADISKGKPRGSLGQMTRLEQELQQSVMGETMHVTLGIQPLPDLYDETMMDMLPQIPIERRKYYFFNLFTWN